MASIDDSNDVNKALSAFSGWISDDSLLDLAGRFSSTYRDLAKNSTEHFLVTPVTALPTGKEKGKFLVIDVGGSNLRVGFIELLGEPENGVSASPTPAVKFKRSYDKNWPIEEHLKMDKAEDLFRWIGDCIAEIITDAVDDLPPYASVESLFGEELLLGMTFSFPMAQNRLSEATLLPMGKGFAISSDLNLGQMMLAGYSRHVVETTNSDKAQSGTRSSTKKRKLSRLPRIRIAAITNDTVATFASLAYTVKAAPNSRVAMGLIMGTGTNATVPMKPSDLHPSKLKELADPEGVETIVINTEWTISGTDRPLNDLGIKTKWDLALDENCDRPGFQPFEYMTAGRYLGEIVRLAFVDLVANDLGEASIPPSLTTKNALPTRFLSEVVARTDDGELAQKLEEKYAPITSRSTFWTPARVKLMKSLAYAVQQRSSALVAAASIGLLNCVHEIQIDRPTEAATQNGNGIKNEQEELVIAYTGGTISQYPKWLETCQTWVDALVTKASSANSAKHVVLKEALDGGIIGAGVLAGMTDEIA